MQAIVLARRGGVEDIASTGVSTRRRHGKVSAEGQAASEWFEYLYSSLCSSTFVCGVCLQAEIPIQVIFPTIFATIIYLLVGFLLEAKPYFLFTLFIVLTSNAGISLG